jgi:hypothetical protein
VQNKENLSVFNVGCEEQIFQAIRPKRAYGPKVEPSLMPRSKSPYRMTSHSSNVGFEDRSMEKTITFGSGSQENSFNRRMTFNRFYKEHIERDISSINERIQMSLDYQSEEDLDY